MNRADYSRRKKRIFSSGPPYLWVLQLHHIPKWEAIPQEPRTFVFFGTIGFEIVCVLLCLCVHVCGGQGTPQVPFSMCCLLCFETGSPTRVLTKFTDHLACLAVILASFLSLLGFKRVSSCLAFYVGSGN